MKNLLFLLFSIACISVQGQTSAPLLDKTAQASTPLKQHNLLLQQAVYTPIADTRLARTTAIGPIYNPSLWAHRVDSTWGSGWPTADKLSVLNRFWGHVDSLYPCFVHLPAYNWDSIVNGMRTEISAGVSAGRYAAMINYLLRLINDGHTNFYDYSVNYGSSVYQGLPLFRGESGSFGACVTPLHDTLAMVYDVEPGHRLGLQPGDIILGYNSVPWATLVRTILAHNLPNSVYIGSTDSATWHRYIQAAGENWYLFDTINIKKCNGTIENYPTSILSSVLYRKFCTEQLAVPGVKRPSYNGYYINDSSTTYGMVTGTRIGYIYMYDCLDTSGNLLLNAARTLIQDSMATGLILDIRTNFGGGFRAFWKAYQYLTSGGAHWVGYGLRSDPNDRNAMVNTGLTSWYDVYDTDPGWFDYPIAILCGPNSISAGDFLPVMFKHNPKVKLFGKSTAGAYGHTEWVEVGHTGFQTTMQGSNFFEASNPSYYITHTMSPINFPVWLSQDSVCAGVDNVVTTAINWIQGGTALKNNTLQAIGVKVYPNPAHSSINIAITSPYSQKITIKLCSMQGVTVTEISYSADKGDNMLKITNSLPSGCYYLVLQTDTGEKVVKQITLIN